MMNFTELLLCLLVLGSVAQVSLLTLYLRRKKPGPKPGSKRGVVKLPTPFNQAPKKRFTARDYPEIPME